jgi:hypothetical protein
VPGNPAAATALINHLMSLRTYGVPWTLYIDAKPADREDGRIQQEYYDTPPGVFYMRLPRDLSKKEEKEAKDRAKNHWICVNPVLKETSPPNIPLTQGIVPLQEVRSEDNCEPRE